MYKIETINIAGSHIFGSKKHVHFRTESKIGLFKVLSWHDNPGDLFSGLFRLTEFVVLIDLSISKKKYIKAWLFQNNLEIPKDVNLQNLTYLGNVSNKTIWLEEICIEDEI